VDEGVDMGNVFTALEQEWPRINRDRTTASHLADVRRAAGNAPDLATVETYVRAAPPPDADHVLLTLVTHVITSDERTAKLAARTLLQLLLPGTRKLARKWWALGDHDERAAAAVAAVYHHIHTYPLQRRPGRVAANILMDASYDLSRLIPKLITTPTQDPTLLRTPHTTATPEPHPAELLADILTDAITTGTLTQPDAELIARTRIAGEPVDTIAKERNRTPRTLWHRRQHAEQTLHNLGITPAI
jgi:hypothetical protein